jgi:hypothetical protein
VPESQDFGISGPYDIMNAEMASQPAWQRLGEIELLDWESEASRTDVRNALSQSVAGFVSFDEMRAPLESAIFDALARKSPAKASGCGQRLVISCLAPAKTESVDAQQSTGWSFFVIERPAMQQSGGAVEIIELCLYHE